MSGALLDCFFEPKIYISALNLKYENQIQYDSISVLTDKDQNSEILNFFIKNFQFPKDLGLVHSACAGLHYIILTELNYSKKISETDFSKWQKLVTPFVDKATDVIISFMNHKWMIEGVYKSCLLTTINLLKLAVKSNSKITIIKILKYLAGKKSHFNDFHVELTRELLVWATDIKTNLSAENEKLVLQCLNRLFSYNSGYSRRIAAIFTVIWANSLACKDANFYNLFFSDEVVPNNITESLYHSKEFVNKIINLLDTFKLFLIHGPNKYFASSKSPQPTLFHNISIDNMLKLGIFALKIANLCAKNQFIEEKSAEEQILDDSVFVTKAKMNFVPMSPIDIDLFVDLYRAAVEMLITLVTIGDQHHHLVFTAGTLYKDYVKEVLHCDNNLESQKILFFFGGSLASFLDVFLNNSPIKISLFELEPLFDLLVLNQLELLSKTKIKDKKLIFTIGKRSLEILTIFTQFVSKNLLPNILTDLPMKIIYSLEHVVRIYIAAIRGDGNGWEGEFIYNNMQIILKFLSFAFSDYLQVPINIINNVFGLIKLYDLTIDTHLYKNMGIAQSSLRIDSIELLRRYQQVWEKMLLTPSPASIEQEHVQEDKKHEEPQEHKQQTYIPPLEYSHIEDIKITSSTDEQEAILERMKKRSEMIKKLKSQ